MRAVICRTNSGSFPFGTWNSPTTSSPKVPAALPVHEFAVGEKNQGVSPAIGCEIGQRGRICRVPSMPSMIRSEMMDLSSGNKNICKFGSRSLPDKILEEEVSTDTDNCRSYGVGNWPRRSIPVEELGFSDGGMGTNWNFGSGDGGEFSTGGFGGGSSGKSSMASYYEQMLKSYPTNALLLRNYGKCLQEVEKDFVKAEEYYGRAILACPEDGELLSLYGKLIWETQRDESRAKSYFDQAVNASPDDCTVLGSYASFMWQTDDDDDDEEEEEMVSGAAKMMVEVCS